MWREQGDFISVSINPNDVHQVFLNLDSLSLIFIQKSLFHFVFIKKRKTFKREIRQLTEIG